MASRAAMAVACAAASDSIRRMSSAPGPERAAAAATSIALRAFSASEMRPSSSRRRSRTVLRCLCAKGAGTVAFRCLQVFLRSLEIAVGSFTQVALCLQRRLLRCRILFGFGHLFRGSCLLDLRPSECLETGSGTLLRQPGHVHLACFRLDLLRVAKRGRMCGTGRLEPCAPLLDRVRRLQFAQIPPGSLALRKRVVQVTRGRREGFLLGLQFLYRVERGLPRTALLRFPGPVA